MPRITKRVVEEAEIRPAEYFIWCDDLPGFGVRIYPSGRRGYLVQYRADNRTRRAKIGLHGHLTAEEARRQAMGLLGEVAKGGDPAEERATNRAAMTVAQLCQRYREALGKGLIMGKGGQPKKPLTIQSDLGRIDGHIVPLLGNKRVKDVTPVDVARFIRSVSAGTTARSRKTEALRGKSVIRGGRGVATRAAGLLGGILTFAVSEGVIPANPATGVRKPAYQAKKTRLTPDQYRVLGTALRRAEAAGTNPTAIAAIRLLALSGCRRGEVLGLRWAEVDADGHAFRLTDSKEGKSVRPIGAAVFRVLDSLERSEGGEWVLPGERRDLPYGGLKGVWTKLIKDAGLTGITIHSLRHGFASTAGDAGYSEATIGAMLGHASGSVTGRYTHLLDRVLIAAADQVSTQIAAALDGDAGTDQARDHQQ